MNRLSTFLLPVLLSTVILSCKNAPAPPAPVAEKPVQAVGYDEKHRLQLHFSPPAKWMNDPNGMFFYEGEWHLFYQHYPDSSVWGPMHWGHAVSTDLVHWQNLPIAIYPDSSKFIFSGSAVIDWKNTSGFGTDGKPPLVAMFTIHDQALEKKGGNSHESQGIAFSNDRGRTWTKFTGNPVIPNPGGVADFRDPKVIWDEARAQWVVAIAVGQHDELWHSPDLKKWTKLSEFGTGLGAHDGVWECPDIFPIKVVGTEETKWAWLVNLNPGNPNGGSGTQYFIGDFDGKNFTIDPDFAKNVQKGKAVWLDWGKDNYAGVTFSDVPKTDGRRILMGWMSNWEYANKVPTEAWRNAATLPRELILKKTGAGYRLFSRPVKELEKLRDGTADFLGTEIAGQVDITQKLGFAPTYSEWSLEFELPEKLVGRFGIELSNAKNEKYRVGFDASKNAFFSDRTKSGDLSFSKTFGSKISLATRSETAKTVKMRVFFDNSSMELFADDGSVVMTEIFFPTDDFSKINLFAEGGKAVLTKGTAYRLRSAWR